jgi:transglutaminase-like putative cysteine protease
MRYKIIHETHYQFSEAVFLEPHIMRFQPKLSAYQQPQSFSLHIAAEPAGMHAHSDAEGNLVHTVWFDGSRQELKVIAQSEVQILAHNPFTFLVHPASYNTVPFAYEPSLNTLLQPALQTAALPKEMIAYAQAIAEETNHQTLSFLITIAQRIHKDFVLEYRHSGAAFPPAETFALKHGSCRDLTWMLIHLLRQRGIAARFVSGYFFIPEQNTPYELHAWVEAYVPGAGWFGIDPSHGIATADNHIAVAASAQFENTMPITGSYRGGASVELSTTLQITLG